MFTPLPPDSWTLDHAAHLLSRAGFGGTPDQIRDLHRQGLSRAVESLLAGSGPQLPPPEWTSESPASRRDLFLGWDPSMDETDRRSLQMEFMRQDHDRIVELRSWWLERMRQGRRPLLEKMTFFWHGHFATSYAKVKNAGLMWRQNETLRSNALGNFGALLRAMTRDPAMIRWLDLGRSRKGEPNENFAREVLELFTLGEGHYTETDVKEAARAFTGHRVDPRTQEFVFQRRAHDDGEKTFLGRSGNFAADDIVGIILSQDQCPRFLGRRLAEFLVADTPQPQMIESLAATLRATNFEIAATLRALFTSREFHAPGVVRAQIKGPVEWIVNSCVALGSPLPRQPALDFFLTRLGQVPFAPPNVRGWEGGKSWISSSTLILRYNLATALLGKIEKGARASLRPGKLSQPDLAAVAPAELRNQPDALADALVFRIFGTPRIPRMQTLARNEIASSELPVTDATVREICGKLMSTPEFQLT